jgi:hypothetical protein
MACSVAAVLHLHVLGDSLDDCRLMCYSAKGMVAKMEEINPVCGVDAPAETPNQSPPPPCYSITSSKAVVCISEFIALVGR